MVVPLLLSVSYISLWRHLLVGIVFDDFAVEVRGLNMSTVRVIVTAPWARGIRTLEIGIGIFRGRESRCRSRRGEGRSLRGKCDGRVWL